MELYLFSKTSHIKIDPLTFFSFPFTMLKLSSESFKFTKQVSFSVSTLECENCRCLICNPLPVANNSLVNAVTVLSKSYIDSDWIGEEIWCRLAFSSTDVTPGHSKNRPERKPKNENMLTIGYNKTNIKIICEWT